MPAPSTLRRAAAHLARFGITPATAPAVAGYPVLDDAAQRRAAHYVGKVRIYSGDMFSVALVTDGAGGWRWHAKGKHASHEWSEAPGKRGNTGSMGRAQWQAAERLDAIQGEVGRWETHEDRVARFGALPKVRA